MAQSSLKTMQVKSQEEICDVDVVIIGAGAAGLVVADQLQKICKDIKFVILEAKGKFFFCTTYCLNYYPISKSLSYFSHSLCIILLILLLSQLGQKT